MSKSKLFLIISTIVSLLATIIIEFYILMAEGWSYGLINQPTALGGIIIIIIKGIPLATFFYHIFLLFFENKLNSKVKIYTTSVFCVLSVPYSLFLVLYLREVVKNSKKTYKDSSIIIVVVITLLLTLGVYSMIDSNSPLLTYHRETSYSIDPSHLNHDDVTITEFYSKVFFFNEKFSYSIADFEFQINDNPSIDYDSIVYDIKVDDVFLCKDKTSTSIVFDDHCDGLNQERSSYFYGNEEVSLYITIKFMKGDSILLEQEYEFPNIRADFRRE